MDQSTTEREPDEMIALKTDEIYLANKLDVAMANLALVDTQDDTAHDPFPQNVVMLRITAAKIEDEDTAQTFHFVLPAEYVAHKAIDMLEVGVLAMSKKPLDKESMQRLIDGGLKPQE